MSEGARGPGGARGEVPRAPLEAPRGAGDLPGEGGPEEELFHRTGLRRSSRAPGIAIGVALLAAAAVALWLRLRAPAVPPGEPAAEPPAAAPAPGAAEAPEAPSPQAAPGPQEARALLEAISAAALFRAGLPGDPVRRWAVATDNVALGESPRRPPAFLAPRGAFSVVRRGGRTFVAPALYRRYDDCADAVASIDARALARAYRSLYAALEAAYRALGYPEGSLDKVTARALRRIEEAPVEPGEVEVIEGEGGLWEYRDARLEGLGDVEKHLLRMGPRNTRAIQAKAREIRLALELPPLP